MLPLQANDVLKQDQLGHFVISMHLSVLNKRLWWDDYIPVILVLGYIMPLVRGDVFVISLALSADLKMVKSVPHVSHSRKFAKRREKFNHILRTVLCQAKVGSLPIKRKLGIPYGTIQWPRTRDAVFEAAVSDLALAYVSFE